MTRWPDGYGRVVLESTGSTLDEARRRANDTKEPFWLLAHHQTAARGRRGRPWAMARGNFAATLILHPSEGAGVAALRSFVMSLALYRTFVDITGDAAAFSLKWPNDVLLNGGKVAGILLESTGQGGKLGPLAIGVGVNLTAAPHPDQVEAGAVSPVCLADETGCESGPEPFLDRLAQHYATLETQFTGFGFAPVRVAWLAHAARLGEVITARTGREEIVGTFEDVDANGNLMLRTSWSLRAISAADVFF